MRIPTVSGNIHSDPDAMPSNVSAAINLAPEDRAERHPDIIGGHIHRIHIERLSLDTGFTTGRMCPVLENPRTLACFSRMFIPAVFMWCPACALPLPRPPWA